MRVLEEKMLNAVKDFKNATCGSNTKVVVEDDEVSVYLHGNLIFRQAKGDAPRFTDAGWRTNTTKSRLNVLLTHFNFAPIHQRNWEWFWDERLKHEPSRSSSWYNGDWYIAVM